MASLKHILSLVLILLALALHAQRSDAVTFSQQGGFYDECFSVTLTCSTENHIRYTINGSTPDATSKLYTEPLFLDDNLYSTSNIYTIHTTFESIFYAPDTIQHCITIRAAVFDANENRKSDVATQSYFIKALGCDTHGLPVVSVSTDSLALFDYDTGIYIPGVHFDPNNEQWTGNYYQRGKEWERRVNIEYYNPTDNSGINQECGMRTHGGKARRSTQKGVKFYAREEYGRKKFTYRFFEDLDNNKFDRLVLHPFFNQWISYGINYHICSMMAHNLNIESLATRPVVLFLNGEYWGVYYLCEKPDEKYITEHFGGDEGEYNIMENWYNKCVSGNAANFIQMMNWLNDANLSEPDDYDHICSLIDINNIIDYYCFELFISNYDWPANNTRCWQHGDGKWRWIFFDGDEALIEPDFDAFANATNENGTGWPSDARSTLMFRKLLENNLFSELFVKNFEHKMDSMFSYSYTKPLFDSAADCVRAEIPRHAARFNMPRDLGAWENEIATIDNFLKHRVANVRQQINELFHIDNASLDFGDLYPNPTNGELTLTLSSEKIAMCDAVIYNMYGQQLSSTEIVLQPGVNTVNLSYHYAPGFYVIKIGNKTKRFIIQ